MNLEELAAAQQGTLSRKRCLILEMIRNLDRELRIPAKILI
jgi:antitoxin component HigA of HigAB toxin-antitoxin module